MQRVALRSKGTRAQRKKKLAPGGYTLVIVASNGAGVKSTPDKLSFTIVS